MSIGVISMLTNSLNAAQNWKCVGLDFDKKVSVNRLSDDRTMSTFKRLLSRRLEGNLKFEFQTKEMKTIAAKETES